MTLGETIHRLRTEKNLSQSELADALEVSRQSISKWETDSSVPELDKLIRLAQVFDVSLDQLVLGREAQAEPAQQCPRDSRDIGSEKCSGNRNSKTAGMVLFAVGGIVLLMVPLLSSSVLGGHYFVFSLPAVRADLCFLPEKCGPVVRVDAVFYRQRISAVCNRNYLGG